MIPKQELIKSIQQDFFLKKGRSKPVGTVTGDYKKVAEGKWVKVGKNKQPKKEESDGFTDKNLREFEKVKTGEKTSVTQSIQGIKFNVKKEKGLGFSLYVDNRFSDADYDFDEIMEITKERVEEEISGREFNQRRQAEENKKRSVGFKDISPYKIKNILMEIIPQKYMGNKHQAMTGSDYHYINGKTVRFSDHDRPATSKWNFIHGGSINAPTGLISKKEIATFIENKLGIKDYDAKKLNSAFDNIK